jgi:hypothetical protein
MGRSTLLWVHAPAHDRCMHLLLIEDRPGIAANSAEALERAGHHVHRCHESDTKAFPCAALTASCPLEGPQPIDLVVDVRGGSDATATAGEAGGTCALRRDVPVLVDGRTDPFPGWSAVRREDEDLIPACERAVADHNRARAANIEAEIDRMIGAGSEGSAVTFSNTQTGTSILIKVPIEVTPQIAGTLATRVHAIERDRGAVHSVLDIAVTGIGPVPQPQ